MTEEPPVCPPEGVGAAAEEYMRESAVRVLMNYLWEFGARVVSLLGIEMRHLIVAGPFVDGVIPFSKGKKGGFQHKNCALPAEKLWTTKELRHLREFVAWMKATGRYDPHLRLTEIAGLGRFEGKPSAYLARRVLGRLLKKAERCGRAVQPALYGASKSPQWTHPRSYHESSQGLPCSSRK